MKYNNFICFGLILTLKICLVSNETGAVFVDHLKNICKVRVNLPQADSVKLVHAFMSTRLDCSNAFFAGKQELIQNTYTQIYDPCA